MFSIKKGEIKIDYAGKTRIIPYYLGHYYNTLYMSIMDKNGHFYQFRHLYGKWEKGGGLIKKIPPDMLDMLYEEFDKLIEGLTIEDL